MPKQRKPVNAGKPDATDPATTAGAAAGGPTDTSPPESPDIDTAAINTTSDSGVAVDTVGGEATGAAATGEKAASGRTPRSKTTRGRTTRSNTTAGKSITVDATGDKATTVGATGDNATTVDATGDETSPVDAAGDKATGGDAAGDGAADGEKVTASRIAYSDILLQPSKAELAAARQAAAEPGFVGLVAPRPAIPRQPVPTDADAPTAIAGTRTKAWRIVTGAAAAVAIAAAVFAVSASESTEVLAETVPTVSPSVTPSASAPPLEFLSVGTGSAAGLLIVPNGHVLYYNDQDGAPPNGIPACVDACAQAWAPVAPADGVPLAAGPGVNGFIYTLVRPDGSTQITFNGHPLYEFTVDSPGNVTGSGVTDVFNGRAFSWHAASATDTPVIPSPSASPSVLLPPEPSLPPSTSPSPSPSR